MPFLCLDVSAMLVCIVGDASIDVRQPRPMAWEATSEVRHERSFLACISHAMRNERVEERIVESEAKTMGNQAKSL